MASQSLINPDPMLPPELEHRIFEIAAIAHPDSIPSLMLVACRVKDWVEPLLYRTILLSSEGRELSPSLGPPNLTDDMLQGLIKERSPTFFFHIKNLFIDYTVDSSTVECCLAACTGVTNLFLQRSLASADHVVQRLGAIRGVQFLTIDVRAILEPLSNGSLHFFLLAVTHLELLEMDNLRSAEEERVCASLALIPRLSHVALNPGLHDTVSHAGLHADTRLQCIVFFPPGPYSVEPTDPLFDDSRFVCIEQSVNYRLDWIRGATSGDDCWALADEFIAARRAGRVDRTRLYIVDTDQSWRT
ncbi:hypothetical protein MVEN_00646100 [Mycena venus]|uniref:Uncharacterized protein n=1 Tax=Mycena venus TaxID=2733690 RepID=A0A8H6YMZ4_9AGAR|nr:hypothetical protein MVEN_00646100 [Mycena venus]